MYREKIISFRNKIKDKKIQKQNSSKRDSTKIWMPIKVRVQIWPEEKIAKMELQRPKAGEREEREEGYVQL